MPIVAIGGGDLRTRETLGLDRFIVGLAAGGSPAVLFVPTASEDAPEYIEQFTRVYENRLGCRVATLRLIESPPELSEMRALVDDADIIYVGGGNTKRMIARWRTSGFDDLLGRAHRDGKILCGLSAGAICWFDSGFSDSEKFSSPGSDWNYTETHGLSLVQGMFCPHLDSENRMLPLIEYLGGTDRVVYACSDDTAIYADSGEPEALVLSRERSVFRIESSGGRVCVDRIEGRLLGG